MGGIFQDDGEEKDTQGRVLLCDWKIVTGRHLRGWGGKVRFRTDCQGACCLATKSCLTAALCTVACQPLLPMGFSRQEYWSGLPFPLPGDLPDSGVEPTSPVTPSLPGGFFTTAPPGKPTNTVK